MRATIGKQHPARLEQLQAAQCISLYPRNAIRHRRAIPRERRRIEHHHVEARNDRSVRRAGIQRLQPIEDIGFCERTLLSQAVLCGVAPRRRHSFSALVDPLDCAAPARAACKANPPRRKSNQARLRPARAGELFEQAVICCWSRYNPVLCPRSGPFRRPGRSGSLSLSRRSRPRSRRRPRQSLELPRGHVAPLDYRARRSIFCTAATSSRFAHFHSSAEIWITAMSSYCRTISPLSKSASAFTRGTRSRPSCAYAAVQDVPIRESKNP